MPRPGNRAISAYFCLKCEKQTPCHPDFDTHPRAHPCSNDPLRHWHCNPASSQRMSVARRIRLPRTTGCARADVNRPQADALGHLAPRPQTTPKLRKMICLLCLSGVALQSGPGYIPFAVCWPQRREARWTWAGPPATLATRVAPRNPAGSTSGYPWPPPDGSRSDQWPGEIPPHLVDGRTDAADNPQMRDAGR